MKKLTSILLFLSFFYIVKSQSVCLEKINNFIDNSLDDNNSTNLQLGSYFPIFGNIYFPHIGLTQFGANSTNNFDEIQYGYDYSKFYSLYNTTQPFSFKIYNDTQSRSVLDSTNWNIYPPLFNTPQPPFGISNNKISIYIPKEGNTYNAYSVASTIITNLKDTTVFSQNNNLINCPKCKVFDNFKFEKIINKTFISPNNLCQNVLYPTCQNYKLSFYIRPSESFNFMYEYNINATTNLRGDSIKNYLYFKKDIQYMDSLSLISYSSDGFSTDTFTITNLNILSDSTNWHYVELNFQVQDTTIALSIIPNINLDSLIYNYESNFNYKGYIDSLNQYLPNKAYLAYFTTMYLFDSISLVPVGFENLDLCLPDTSFCESFSINVDAYQPEFTRYEWSTGDTTSSINIDSPGVYSLTAYYPCGVLCDEFTVFEEPANYLLPLSYGDTLAICPLNLPITLNAADTFATYSWSNGDTTFNTQINQEGMLYLETQHFCGVLRDSVYLKLRDKENIDLIPFTDTLFCASDLPFALQINDTLQNYVWSNGGNTSQNTFDAAGTYFVNAYNGCHYYADTFTLQTENLVTDNFKHQNIYCPEDFPIVLTAPSTLNPIWNTGENTNSITISNAVNNVYVHNSFSAVCGNRTDSFFVYVLPDTITSLPQILIDDFCLEEGFYQFSTIVNDTNFVYQWENQTSLNFTTKGGVTQTLSISNACLSLEIDTFIERCPEQIAFALPTAFSPNNDGVNDVFQLLYLNPNYQFNHLKIYNRWGELIFNSKDRNIGWDGVYTNKNAPIGTYIYHLELQNENQEIETFKGNLSLIR